MTTPTDVPPSRPPNHLIHETSPYLRQHAYNPVNWYPWSDEALRKARELDRPIFLSIGYSSCHWCHVMERESFEDPEIAAILNDNFISIKVDREERPDLDSIYMTAVQLLTGSGGWPMSVFLTPDLKPFWGGTYFPPTDRYGRPGFGSILRRLAEIYRTSRDQVEEQSGKLAGYLAEKIDVEPATELPGREVLDRAVDDAMRSFEPQHGGFGPAPKFPRSIEISKLLRYWRRGTLDAGSGPVKARAADALAMSEKTLESMALGGLYDQIGGGFHRYSTDERWLVPHFEKMLYDNALLARIYAEGYQATGRDLFARIARETLDYVLREMTSPEGGFYSATDADSEGEEGKFFVWTPEEVAQVLGAADARAICEYYNITPGGNFEHGKSIPHVTKPLEAVARALRLEPAALAETLQRGREALYRARETRVKPFRDEKVLAAWNGLMISAFARVSQALDEPRHLEVAGRAAEFVWSRMRVDGRLHRTYKDGRSRFPAYLDDHAYLCEAFLDLHEAGFRLEHLGRARELADALLSDFWDADGSGFFYTAPHHTSLIARKKDTFDNATPSGSGVAASCFLRLERLTGRKVYRERAEEVLRAAAPLFERATMAMSSTLLALDFALHPALEIAITGDPGDPRTRLLIRAVHETYLPARILVSAAAPVPRQVAEAIPLLEGKTLVDGRPAAYVCRDYACQAPVTGPEELKRLLEGA